jgi:hypothetical protein
VRKFKTATFKTPSKSLAATNYFQLLKGYPQDSCYQAFFKKGMDSYGSLGLAPSFDPGALFWQEAVHRITTIKEKRV